MAAKGKARRFDVVIGGGGYAGLALAGALSQAGLDVAVADPAFGSVGQFRDPRASTIVAGARRLFETIGAWDAISGEAEPVHGMRITDSRLADIMRPVLLRFDNEAAPGEPFAHVAPNGTIRIGLLDAAKVAGSTLVPTGIAGFEQSAGKIAISLSDGSKIAATLLVAADGVTSNIRGLARIPFRGWNYDHAAIVSNVRLEQPHDGIAIQHFVDRGTLAFLPLPNQHASIVWAEPRLQAERLAALSGDEFQAALQQRAGYDFGEITPIGPRAVRPLKLGLAQHFHGHRIALIGDAAHAMHPIAGQGMNFGLRDVAALAEAVVDAARLGLDIGSEPILQGYDSWRRLDTVAMLAATDGLINLFGSSAPAARMVRDTGMGLVDRAPRFKSAVIKSAAALTGNAPRLLRGEAL
ncbi:FAD-dependent monooxygenase [Flaviflagellibacter deserti]|uniref:FAD-dependent monooxygenase n=1 Tax=Flaviflagellibacter deserti TaxID=2267266 RepID=A0ABV9Z644_9HYPH